MPGGGHQTRKHAGVWVHHSVTGPEITGAERTFTLLYFKHLNWKAGLSQYRYNLPQGNWKQKPNSTALVGDYLHWKQQQYGKKLPNLISWRCSYKNIISGIKADLKMFLYPGCHSCPIPPSPWAVSWGCLTKSSSWNSQKTYSSMVW